MDTADFRENLAQLAYIARATNTIFMYFCDYFWHSKMFYVKILIILTYGHNLNYKFIDTIGIYYGYPYGKKIGGFYESQ